MGYTIRDYVLDNIKNDIIKLEKEYDMKIIMDNNCSDNIQVSVQNNFTIISYSINFDTNLSCFYADMENEIELNLWKCENCEKWKYNVNFIDGDFTDLVVCSDECWDELDSVEYHNWLANY